MSSGCSMFVCVLLFIWGAIEKVWLSNEVGKISRSIWFCRVVQRSSTLYVHGMVFQYCPSVSSLSPGAVSYISNIYISLRVYVHHEAIANTLSSGESKLGSGGSGYWSLLLEPTCPAKAHLHMLKALLGYSSWRCTSSTRLSRPLNAREKSDCSVVVSSLCQSMLVPSSCYRNPSDVKFWQNCGFWRCRSLNRLLKPVDKTAESVVSIHMYDHICIMLISFLVSRLRVLSDFGIFIAVLFDQLANPHSLGFMDPLRSSSMHGHNASLHPRRM